LNSEYHNIFNILDELRTETRKTIETIRKYVHQNRPVILNIDQMEDYINRIKFANEIMLNLDDLMRKTFDTYIEFISIHWETKENFEFIEHQKILAEKYDMSMIEWQSILSKIERFNETRSFV
jgi:hypothetical protein